ncbi:protein set-like [Plasmopara halstedii]|uniref:Protein set-like n=1 Tax=Plasmopara halstedii TaxID=4781 RepID=A0A0P1AXW8_PLAHL|nr:protein set-like [Plasmopara halstedii]CEG46642.1 protein set-like [Plasmopara halstedii]|eukprot:XP_024583011.1 protein set-like [Plasmopara halstedii]
MTSPPSPKRQRIEELSLDVKVQKVLEAVKKVEEELEQVNEEQAKEILVIENKYNAKKRPTYVKRNKLLADLPHFWKQAFTNHPLVGNFIQEDDDMLLDFLQSFDVTFVGDDGSFKMELTFQENPYFSPNVLWKQVKFTEDGDEVEVTASEVTWKEKAEVVENSQKFPFFQWFVSTDGDQDVAEIIKEELWKNPVSYYMMNEDEEEVEEDEEEEEVEGEDEDDDKDEGEKDEDDEDDA